MRVLVTVASKHGSTAEIGDAIEAGLREAGLQVDRREPDTVISLDGIDAVVIGSGVYAGSWLGPAKALVERLGPQLQARPVWLFSSGPLGEPPKPAGDPVQIWEFLTRTNAVEHRVFPGALHPGGLSIAERVIVKGVHAPYGDFRRWDLVQDFTVSIAAQLSAPADPATRP
jgi:menaquinone-dependent protoporphyrinogen oxidase